MLAVFITASLQHISVKTVVPEHVGFRQADTVWWQHLNNAVVGPAAPIFLCSCHVLALATDTPAHTSIG
jgi:hypothetical protein